MSFLANLLGLGRDPRRDLAPLWHATVELGRDPHFYAECGVADTVEGRFDMVTAALALVLLRMEREPELVEPSVRLTELFVDDMDGQLRESGVGDVVVGKHLGRLRSVMGGRLGAYRDNLAADKELEEAVARNVSLSEGGSPACVAIRLREVAARLDRTRGADLLEGNIAA